MCVCTEFAQSFIHPKPSYVIKSSFHTLVHTFWLSDVMFLVVRCDVLGCLCFPCKVVCSLQELVSCIMSLRPRFHIALQRALNDASGRDTDEGLSEEAKATEHDDDDTVRCMVRLFLDITDAYQILVAQGSAEVRLPQTFTRFCVQLELFAV
jgi:hypothetical protein